jgi:hypothetical protein
MSSTANTDERGVLRFLDLLPATYSVEISYPGPTYNERRLEQPLQYELVEKIR